MTGLLKPFQRLFQPKHTMPSGVFHYKSPEDDPRNYRLHLRMDENGEGLLIVNASTILHLNQTAAEYAYHLVHNTDPDRVANIISARYQVDKNQAYQDYMDLAERVRALVEIPDLDPVTFLDFERREPFSGRLAAPYRLDCALTYRLPTDQPVEAAPIERVSRELGTEEWKTILKKAWEAGIPHIIFTGGEPTLREDLPELVKFIEDQGQVSGLLSEGTRLTDPDYMQRLLTAGLDHLMILLHPENPDSWLVVEKSMIEDLAVVVHITLTAENAGNIKEIIQKLAELQVTKVSLSAADESLSRELQTARDWAAFIGLELVWNIPVPYSSLHPVALETADARMEGAGRAWLYVEPDGDVRPTQGDPKVLGNMLTDDWRSIWQG